MHEKQITISVDQLPKYRKLLDASFLRCYKGENVGGTNWSMVYDYEFWVTKVNNASFLATIGYLLDITNPEGVIDLDKAHEFVSSKLGEYFRENKLANAVAFIQEGLWEDLP